MPKLITLQILSLLYLYPTIILATPNVPFWPTRTDYHGNGSSYIRIEKGDFNNDNFPDIALLDDILDTVEVFTGDSAGKLTRLNSYTVASTPRDFLSADFDLDGNLDLMVAGSNTLSIRHGNGDGTFTKLVRVTLGGRLTRITSADINADSYPDLAIVDDSSNKRIFILLNDQNRGFLTPTSFTASNVSAIKLGDFNSDNIPDLVLSEDNAKNKITLYQGDGLGGFTKLSSFTTGKEPVELLVSDINHDGNLDVLTINQSNSDISIFIGDGLAGFTIKPLISAVGLTPSDLELVDLSRDGYQDLIVLTLDGKLNVFISDKTGGFTFREQITNSISTVTALHQQFTFLDIDGDRAVDIVSIIENENTFTLHHGDGDGSFTQYKSCSTDIGPYFMSEGDFNADGFSDLIVSNNIAKTVSILIGDGQGGVTNINTFPVNCCPQGTVSGDFDEDGILDFALGLGGGGISELIIYKGDGLGGFTPIYNYTTSDYISRLAVADLNKDGHLDIVAPTLTSTELIMLGDGTANFPTINSIPITSYPLAVKIIDINNDSNLDIVTVNQFAKSAQIDLGDGLGNFTSNTSLILPDMVTSLEVVDIDMDSFLDLIVGGYFGAIYILNGDGSGNFNNLIHTIPSTCFGWSSELLVHDFNFDLIPDIASANLLCSQLALHTGLGGLNFNTTLSGVGIGPATLRLGKFSNNANQQLAIVNYVSSDLTIFHNNSKPVYANIFPQSIYATPGTVLKVNLRFENNTSQTQQVTATLNTDLPGQNLTPITLGLAANQTKTKAVKLFIPNNALGDYYFKIKAKAARTSVIDQDQFTFRVK